MHDVAVALDGAEGLDADGAGVGDAAEVVACEIDQHDVLGGFLRVGEELAFEERVVGIVCAARARAGDGAERGDAAGQPHEGLWRGADDLRIAKVEVVHVGRRVEQPQGAVDLERIGMALAGEADGEHELEDIARADVVFHAGDAFDERGFAQAGLWRLVAAARRGGRLGPAQGDDEFAAEALPFPLLPGVQERDAAREVIEDEQRTRRDEEGVRVSGGGRGRGGEAFKAAHEVVGDEAGEAAIHGQAGDAGEEFGRGGECRADPGEHGGAVGRIAGLDTDAGGFAQTDEAVATEPLAALDAFEKEPGAEGGELAERRDGRVEIGGDIEGGLHGGRGPRVWGRRKRQGG